MDVFFVYKGKILCQCLLCVLNGKILRRVSDVKPNRGGSRIYKGGGGGGG